MFERFLSNPGLRALLAALLTGVCATGCAQPDGVPEAFQAAAEVVATYHHDTDAFTQGLVIHDGRLFESTGQYGGSSLREVDLQTGEVERIARLNQAYFAEGIAIMNDRVYQLTWQNQVVAVYDLETFEIIGTFRYQGEGWGLTHDGESLILSDGTAGIRFIDPEDFTIERSIQVTGPDGPVVRLNELEYIEGEIWANVWYEDHIVRIDPETGSVVGTIDLSEVYSPALRGREEVANGIAFDPSTRKIYVTGKNWPQLYEIRVVPRTN